MCASHVITKRFFLTWITHPNTGHVSWRVTDKPDVGVIIYSTGLTCEWNTERLGSSSSSTLNYAAHHRNHGQRNVFVYHFVSSVLPLLERGSIAIQNFSDHVWLDANAFVREC